MSTQQNQSFSEKLNTKIRNSITIKLIAIGILILVLLIPITMIRSLVRERERRRKNAIREVSSKWGEKQTIAGLILSIPYKEYFKDKDNKIVETIKFAHFLPDNLNIKGGISAEMRYRGIYDVVVYRSRLEVSGSFSGISFNDWNISGNNIMWKDAFISLGISDMKGIQEYIELEWNNNQYSFNPGIETKDVISSGASVRVSVDRSSSFKKTYEFSFDLNLNGSKEINFYPLGKKTSVELSSKWDNPSFQGMFLPDKREVTDKGFEAKWEVLHLNRNYPQKWLENTHKIAGSEFGVNLLLPVDQYQKSMRSIKYAIMIISLTFLIFFFVEVLNKKRIHPIQYILVALGLCIFFILLLSISEHLNFNAAYILSSLAIIILITLYSKTIFKSISITRIMCGILIIIYGFMYTIIQLQDYALLMGSIGLFIVLAIVMYLSRKIDWYSLEFDR